MKILHLVQNYWPSVGGMQEVVKRVSEYLVQQGHQVTVATSRNSKRQVKVLNGVDIVDFDCAGNFVDGCSGNDIHKFKDFVKNGDFDIIVFFAAQQWAVDLLLQDLENIKGAKIFVPTGFSCLFVAQWQSYFREHLPNRLGLFDASIVHSLEYRDAQYLIKHGFKNIVCIPNGADESEFSDEKDVVAFRRRFGVPDGWSLILHVGSHTGEKGHRELFEIMDSLNNDQWILLIVGNRSSTTCGLRCKVQSYLHNLRRRKSKIRVVSLSRADTVTAYFASDFMLFPSRIECSPVVLYESMAAGLPFLATDVGNSREILKFGDELGEILLTRFDELGQSCVDVDDAARVVEKWLLKCKNDLDSHKKGRTIWKENFTWTKIAQDYLICYQRVLQKKG